jgi:hypothetical protein
MAHSHSYSPQSVNTSPFESERERELLSLTQRNSVSERKEEVHFYLERVWSTLLMKINCQEF